MRQNPVKAHTAEGQAPSHTNPNITAAAVSSVILEQIEGIDLQDTDKIDNIRGPLIALNTKFASEAQAYIDLLAGKYQNPDDVRQILNNFTSLKKIYNQRNQELSDKLILVKKDLDQTVGWLRGIINPTSFTELLKHKNSFQLILTELEQETPLTKLSQISKDLLNTTPNINIAGYVPLSLLDKNIRNCSDESKVLRFQVEFKDCIKSLIYLCELINMPNISLGLRGSTNEEIIKIITQNIQSKENGADAIFLTNFLGHSLGEVKALECMLDKRTEELLSLETAVHFVSSLTTDGLKIVQARFDKQKEDERAKKRQHVAQNLIKYLTEEVRYAKFETPFVVESYQFADNQAKQKMLEDISSQLDLIKQEQDVPFMKKIFNKNKGSSALLEEKLLLELSKELLEHDLDLLSVDNFDEEYFTPIRTRINYLSSRMSHKDRVATLETLPYNGDSLWCKSTYELMHTRKLPILTWDEAIASTEL